MAVIATGFFDGVHKGHRLILGKLVSEARKRGEQSLVLSFWPHPRMVLEGDSGRALQLLSTPQEKLSMMTALGIDHVEQLPFTLEFSRMGTQQYLRDIVAGRFGGTAILLGYDNRIGHDMLPPARTAELASALGLEVICPPALDAGGTAVSSSRIRKALGAGDVELASDMLGYSYSLEGRVVHGKKLGRTIGFPTANLSPTESFKLIPAHGVYLSEIVVGGQKFHGMTNVGGIIETHIFGFDEEIYGEAVRVSFERRIRDGMNFDGVTELKKQLVQDEQVCKKLLSLQ